MGILRFLTENKETIAQVIGLIAWAISYATARGWLKNKAVNDAYEFAVAATEQWYKLKRKHGESVAPGLLRARAEQIIQRRLGTDHFIDDEMLEGMVFKVTGKSASDCLGDRSSGDPPG